MTYYRVEDLDNDALEALAQEALASRPSPSAMWDERLYVTHAPIMSRAVNQDDLLADSNYEKVLEHLEAFSAVWDDTATDRRACLEERTDVFAAEMRAQEMQCECETCSPSVIDARISDWAWGPIDQLFVRTHWADGTLTQVWGEAMRIIIGLQDYPVFDDSDFSEREYEAFMTDYDDALNDVVNNYPDDSDADIAVLTLRVRLASQDLDLYGDGYASADWDAIADLYRQTRDAYFEERANDALYIGAAAQIPGQTTIGQEN